MVGWAIIQNVEHRREMEKKWNAADRPKIENLSYALKKWSVLDMDVQETLIGGWEMLRELGPDCDPRDVAMLNQLANAYVTQGKYDLAIPLYEECLAILKRYLEPAHPDVVIVEQNILTAQKLRKGQNQ